MVRNSQTWLAVFALVIAGYSGPAICAGQPLADAAQPAAADAAQPAAKADAAGGAAKEDSPLAAEPKTAADLLEATLLMVEIARPTLAKAYLDRLLASNPDEATLLELRDRFGIAPFVRLTKNKELKPTADKLLDLVNAAAIKRATDPARIAMLIANLSGTVEEQVAAFEELRSSGIVVVPPLVSMLNDPQQATLHPTVRNLLLQMGEPVIPALFGALESPNVNVRTHVVATLGHLRAEAAIPYLWYIAVSQSEPAALRMAARDALARLLGTTVTNVDRLAGEGVVARLLRIAREHYRGEYPWQTGAGGTVTLWSWDATAGTVAAAQLKPEVASEILGARFAREALALAPEQREPQVLYVSLTLAAEARLAGANRRLPRGPGTAHDLALSVGPEVIGEVLAEALAAGRPVTAVAALQVLEQIGTVSQIKGPQVKRAPLATALNYPDRRVQFAAARAILQLDPQSPFADANRVVAILNRALSTAEKPHAVVADVSATRGSAVGGLLHELGYEPLVVTSGRDAFRTAAERLDVELVVLHPHIIRWALSETIANLRADARTASLPIVIHGPGDLRPKMQVHLANYRLMTFASESQTSADLARQIRPWLQHVQTPPLMDGERLEQRAMAVSWLAHIAGGRRTRIFDIGTAEQSLGVALDDPLLAADALEALGEIASGGSQRRIAKLVLDATADEKLREAAALKLAFHVQRFGLLLEPGQITGLHQATAAAKEPGLQTALLSVIGSLKPDPALVGKRLQSFSRK